MEKKVLIWETWFFMAFGLFHLHRIWGVIDRDSYAGFWMGILGNKGPFYFTLMGVLAGLCVLGIFTFTKCRGNNYWWRWIYLFGGAYAVEARTRCPNCNHIVTVYWEPESKKEEKDKK